MLSRRDFLKHSATAAGCAWLSQYHAMAAPEKGRYKVRDIKTMVMQGPDRNYTLCKVIADDGTFGIGEAYGSPGAGVKEQVHVLAKAIIGLDPLGIDAIYTNLGTRTDGSAHSLMRAVSGVEMALWDLAGKLLGVPTYKLLGGKFRDKVRVYDHAAPRDMMNKESCREWAAKCKANPAGFQAHKFGFKRNTEASDKLRDGANKVLSTRELINIQKQFENCREAIGFEHDIMVHCHWEYDVRTSIQIADAVEAMKPFWLEDPLYVEYTDAWKRLTESTKVPICTGENITRRQGFKDFIINAGCDILHPDLRNSGGFLETKRIADMAEVFGLPMATHNTGSQVCTYSTTQWASSIRDFIHCETITGKGDWMDKVLVLDGPYIQDGFIKVQEKPGVGIVLNEDVVRAHLAAGETWWG